MLVLLAALLAVAPPAPAQGPAGFVAPPSADWRTLATEHYRLHYPADSAPWAEHVAARLESIRAAVAEEVGFAPSEVADVVISDPAAVPNGFALPILGWPRMVLWTQPPGADSVIGHYRDWPELLAVHEDAHLVHLLRPSRNPLRRTLGAVVPISPLADAPRWVVEGYATVIEGRLTGTGRPNSDLRSAVLRRWALAGKLPSYARLAADEGSYLGMSMAYLAGSAYLEWLEERAGEGALRDLWARLSARRARSFEAAFEGVFADSPRDLWDLFRAETTWRALELERRLADAGEAGEPAAADADDAGGRAGPWREGDLWLDLAWATGRPAVSPDGGMFALVLRHRDAPAELAVYATEVDAEALEEREEDRRRVAEADPEDVPAVDPGPPPRRRLHTLPTVDGAEPAQPRWLPTAADRPPALLLVRRLPDADGFLHPDLFRWQPPVERGVERGGERGGELVRLTRGADLTDPDPAPAGAADPGGWAVAVRNRHGLSQLVRVDLGTGAVTPLTEPAVEVVWDSPRLSPDGRRLAVARHSAGAWELVVRPVDGDGAGGAEEQVLPLPAGATVASPAWGVLTQGEGGEVAQRDAVYAVLGRRGFIDVFAFVETAEGWSRRRVTRVPGAALAPEPALPAGEEPAGVFYLSLEPDGLDLRRMAVSDAVAGGDGAAGAAAPGDPASLDLAAADFASTDFAPVVPPPPPAAPPVFALADLPPAEPYGLGPRQEWLALSGGAVGAAGWSAEAGARAGDLLGRLDTIALGAWGDEGAARGGAVATAWRRLPVELSVHLAGLREEPSRQSEAPALFAPAPARAPVPEPGHGAAGLEVAAGHLDVERLGAELAARWETRAGGGPLSLAGGAWLGRAEPRRPGGGDAVDDPSLFAAAGWSPRLSRGELWGGLDLGGRVDAGEVDAAAGGGWTRRRGGLRLAGGWGDASLAAEWVRGAASGDAVDGPLPAAPWQLFQVGGLPSSLRPSSLDAPRLVVPALPAATLVGRDVEAQRVDLSPGFAPLPLFWARYRAAGAGAAPVEDLAAADWLTLAGVEWRGRLSPLPLLRLPGIGYRLGGAEILDGPAEGERQWWLALTFRP